MESILSHIVNNKKDLSSLKRYLDSNKEKLVKYGKYLNNALQALTPQENTLGIIYLLHAKTKGKMDTTFVTQTEKLLGNLVGKEAHHAPNLLRVIVERYFQIIMTTKDYFRGMYYLRRGLVLFRPTINHLTPMHGYLLCICLKSKNLRYAEPIVNGKIFDIEPPKTGLIPTEFLLFYYYGGLIHIGLKNYKKALYFFETALTLPAYSLNAIMLESYKKYVLVSLIENGKFSGNPKRCSNIVTRHMKKLCSAYVTFGDLYAGKNPTATQEHVVKFTDLFRYDQNFGLVKQCLSIFSKRKILKLQKTYLTISIKQLMKEIDFTEEEDVERLLLGMVKNREISVLINQQDKMVTFVEEVDIFDKSETGVYLESKIDNTIKLFDRLKLMDEEIGLTKKYNSRVLGVREDTNHHQQMPKGRRRGGGGGKLFF